jgi:hypothetical protein
VFGRRLTITYFREQTPDEAELEAKYSNGEEDRAIEELRHKLDEVPFTYRGEKRSTAPRGN